MFNPAWRFTEEALDDFRERYTGFGGSLYEVIQDRIPDAFAVLRLYRSDLHQREDSYAICELDLPFSVQLDPDCEVIVLANEHCRTEIGSWTPDPYEEAIVFIRQYLNKKPVEQGGDCDAEEAV